MRSRELADGIGALGYATIARCELALLQDGSTPEALTCLAENESRIQAEDCMTARLLLWKATQDRAHLAEAKRLLDEALAKVPAEHHASMLANVRVNREIAAAAKAQGL